MALGASTGSVLKLVLTQGLKLVSLGGALGVIGAIVSARLIRTLLYGVTPGDITAYALAVAAMLLIGLLASYLPARRATRVDPMVALRYE
jgi:ABC-type antimicrobial peptide transport system permease subunit